MTEVYTSAGSSRNVSSAVAPGGNTPPTNGGRNSPASPQFPQGQQPSQQSQQDQTQQNQQGSTNV
ncbi:hypothetical protein FRC19_006736, partial [Serendipita sp. 401]